MKKMMRTAALALVTAMMLAITAFAAPIVEEATGFEVQADFDANGVKLTELTVFNDAIVEGGQYMIFVVDGDLPTADSILYVNQKQADEDGEITFENVYPKEMMNSNIMISGTGFTAPVIVAMIQDEPILKGDVDGSGTVDVGDATTLMKVLAGLSGDFVPELDVADVDNSGSIDVGDATTLLKVLAGLEELN